MKTIVRTIEFTWERHDQAHLRIAGVNSEMKEDHDPPIAPQFRSKLQTWFRSILKAHAVRRSRHTMTVRDKGGKNDEKGLA